MLLDSFPNHNTVHSCYRRWRLDGTLARLLDALRRLICVEADGAPEPSVAIVESPSVKATEKGGGVGMTRPRTSTVASDLSS